MSNLQETSEKGFEKRFIAEVLHLIEYDSKKPRDDFGVNFLGQSAFFLTHSNYPFSLLHINEYSNKLKNQLKNGEKVFEGLINKYFLKNNHVLKLILQPDENLANKKNQEEFSILTNKKNKLVKESIDEMKKDYILLQEHQNQVQDLNILPLIKIEDISKTVEIIKTTEHKLAHGNFQYNI